MTIEDRVRQAELDIASIKASAKWAAWIGVALLAWAGINTFFLIPKAVNDKVIEHIGTNVISEIDKILSGVSSKAAKIAQIARDNKTITIDGVCFKPRRIVRCWSGTNTDHMTWVDNESECQGARYSVEGVTAFLATC